MASEKFDAKAFAGKLREEIHDAYQRCDDAAVTPSDILLAVLRAIDDATLAGAVRDEQ